MYNKFIKKNETLDFNTKAYVKLRPFWNDFVQYKTSEEGEGLVRRNKENVARKRYHHHLGSGGYRSLIPKWEKMEAEIIAKGVVPQTVREIGLNARSIGFTVMGEPWIKKLGC